MRTFLSTLRSHYRQFRHRHDYPPLTAPSTTELDTWWDIYHALTPGTNAFSDTIPLAIISNAAWRRLHRFCRDHDIERGHTPWHRFDTPSSIHVWSIDLLHPRRWGELLYTYHPSALCGERTSVMLHDVCAGTRDRDTLEALLTSPGMIGASPAVVIEYRRAGRRPFDPDATLDISRATSFLRQLYAHACGHPLPAYQFPRPTVPKTHDAKQ